MVDPTHTFSDAFLHTAAAEPVLARSKQGYTDPTTACPCVFFKKETKKNRP